MKPENVGIEIPESLVCLLAGCEVECHDWRLSSKDTMHEDTAAVACLCGVDSRWFWPGLAFTWDLGAFWLTFCTSVSIMSSLLGGMCQISPQTNHRVAHFWGLIIETCFSWSLLLVSGLLREPMKRLRAFGIYSYQCIYIRFSHRK